MDVQDGAVAVSHKVGAGGNGVVGELVHHPELMEGEGGIVDENAVGIGSVGKILGVIHRPLRKDGGYAQTQGQKHRHGEQKGGRTAGTGANRFFHSQINRLSASHRRAFLIFDENTDNQDRQQKVSAQ